MTFRKATKTQGRLRLALDGPSGSGKTFTALVVAFLLAGESGRVAVIDTERGSASKYADRFAAYDVLELENFSPQTYTEAIQLAGEAGYDVLIVDSLSHAWEGEGGALDTVDKMASKGGGNSYTAWKDVTPMHRRMIDALLQSPCHIITTMRSKMEYILEADAKGRMVPRKVGMAPIQRAGTEYEFDIVIDLDINHKAIVSKTRCSAMDGLEEIKPGAQWFIPVRDWLTDGAPAPAFLDNPSKVAGVRAHLTKGGVAPERQDELLADWLKRRCTRGAILEGASAEIAASKRLPPAQKAPPEPQKQPEQVSPPAASAPTASAEAPVTPPQEPAQDATPAPAASKPTGPTWADEVRGMFFDAQLPVGLRDDFIAVQIAGGSGATEVMAAWRKLKAACRKDLEGQRGPVVLLAREAKGATTEPQQAESSESAPF